MADKADQSGTTHFDVLVIGGGPGGYVAAIRAAQFGYKVGIVERAKLGGVCLNWGCIPSKALLSNAELMEKLAHQEDWGLKIEGKVSFDWDKVIGRSRDVAGKLNGGVGYLMKKNKIEHITASAKIVGARKGKDPCRVELYDCQVSEERTDAPAKPADKPRQTVTATNVIVATGSVARDLPFAKFGSDPKIWGAREAMYNKERPERLIVVGSGAIGMEFGYFYHAFGTKVTVVEMQDRILPVEDEEISQAMLRHYKKAGIEFKTGMVTTGVDAKGKTVKVTIAPWVVDTSGNGKPDESKAETIEGDRILLAIGVKGRYDGLFDEKLGLETHKDHIKTDYVAGQYGDPRHIDYKTNPKRIYFLKKEIQGVPVAALERCLEILLGLEVALKRGGDPLETLQTKAIELCDVCGRSRQGGRR